MDYLKKMGATNTRFISALKPALQNYYRHIFFITLVFFNIFFIFSCASTVKKEIPKNITINISGLDSELLSKNCYFPVVKVSPNPSNVEVLFSNKKVSLISKSEDSYYFMLPIPSEAAGTTHTLALTASFGNFKSNKVVEYKVLAVDNGKETLWVDPKKVVYPKSVRKRIENEDSDLKNIFEELSNYRYFGKINDPLKIMQITSPFSVKRIFNNEERGYHTGVDLKAYYGTPVFAPAGGKIVLARDLYLCGNGVIIDHGIGVFSMFCHLSKILVDEGRIIDAGFNIGKAGSTGRSTGPHLHWSVKVEEKNVDPLNFMNRFNLLNL